MLSKSINISFPMSFPLRKKYNQTANYLKKKNQTQIKNYNRPEQLTFLFNYAKKVSNFCFHDRQQFRTIAVSSTKWKGETILCSLLMYNFINN